jgi:hypothetical protein
MAVPDQPSEDALAKSVCWVRPKIARAADSTIAQIPPITSDAPIRNVIVCLHRDVTPRSGAPPIDHDAQWETAMTEGLRLPKNLSCRASSIPIHPSRTRKRGIRGPGQSDLADVTANVRLCASDPVSISR